MTGEATIHTPHTSLKGEAKPPRKSRAQYFVEWRARKSAEKKAAKKEAEKKEALPAEPAAQPSETVVAHDGGKLGWLQRGYVTPDLPIEVNAPNEGPEEAAAEKEKVESGPNEAPAEAPQPDPTDAKGIAPMATRIVSPPPRLQTAVDRARRAAKHVGGAPSRPPSQRWNPSRPAMLTTMSGQR